MLNAINTGILKQVEEAIAEATKQGEMVLKVEIRTLDKDKDIRLREFEVKIQ